MNHRKTLLVTALLVAGATFAVGSFAQTATAVAPAPQAAAPSGGISRRSLFIAAVAVVPPTLRDPEGDGSETIPPTEAASADVDPTEEE